MMRPFSAVFYEWVSEYYKSANIGKNGDFYTAVSASKFFGGSLARFIIEKLETNTLTLPLHIVDIGGNNANLLSDIIDFLESISEGVVEHCKFILVETNATHCTDNRILQIKHLSSFTLENNAIFIANELFDALPCEIYSNGKILYLDSNFKYDFLPSSQRINLVAKFANITRGEIPLSYFDLCVELIKSNPKNYKWLFLAFDYGDKIPQNSITMRIFHNHKVESLSKIISNLNLYFKKSDITYNVPFSILQKAFSEIGAKEILFKRQDLALIEDFKIFDLVQDFYNSVPKALYVRESNKIKTLLSISSKFKLAIYSNF